MYIIFETFRLYQTVKKTKKQYDISLKQRQIDRVSHGQICHKITNLKLLYMSSKQKQESEMLKIVYIGSVSIMKET